MWASANHFFLHSIFDVFDKGYNLILYLYSTNKLVRYLCLLTRQKPDWHHKYFTWFHTYPFKLMLILSQLLHSAFFQQRRICQIGFRANKANSQKNLDSINFPWRLISCLIQLFAHYCCCPKSLYINPAAQYGQSNLNKSKLFSISTTETLKYIPTVYL